MDYNQLHDDNERVVALLNKKIYRCEPEIDLTDIQEEWLKSVDLEEIPLRSDDNAMGLCDVCKNTRVLYKIVDNIKYDETSKKYNVRNSSDGHICKYIIELWWYDPHFVLLDDSLSHNKTICVRCLSDWVRHGKAKLVQCPAYIKTQFDVVRFKFIRSGDEENVRQLVEYRHAYYGIPIIGGEKDQSREYKQCGGCELFYVKDSCAYGCEATIENGQFEAGYGSIYDDSRFFVHCEWNNENPNICDRCVNKLLLEGKLKYDLLHFHF